MGDRFHDGWECRRQPFWIVDTMSGKESRYFEMSLESLRSLAGWCAGCAEMALPIFERRVVSDLRPRAAIEGARTFAAGGKRAAQLRALAMQSFAAARQAIDPAATAAARAAGLAASSAYTHPLADVEQTKHIVGPAAYAALALELYQGGDLTVGDEVVLWAVQIVTIEARDILMNMPSRSPGRSRLDKLMYDLDTGIRNREFPNDS